MRARRWGGRRTESTDPDPQFDLLTPDSAGLVETATGHNSFAAGVPVGSGTQTEGRHEGRQPWTGIVGPLDHPSSAGPGLARDVERLAARVDLHIANLDALAARLTALGGSS